MLWGGVKTTIQVYEFENFASLLRAGNGCFNHAIIDAFDTMQIFISKAVRHTIKLLMIWRML